MGATEAARPRPLVTFLSDFGTDDVFVGLCHAAVLAACPQAAVVDLSHAVAPQDVAHGAARLADAVGWVRQPAVHLAVVDPGVGTERRGIVVACASALLVGPDNGLLLPAAERLGGVTGAWELTVPKGASATFHGRDVFAPAAGRLAAGGDPHSLGAQIDPAGLKAAPETVGEAASGEERAPGEGASGEAAAGKAVSGEAASGEAPAGEAASRKAAAGEGVSAGAGRVSALVRDIDRFGNLQLSVRASALAVAGLAGGQALSVRAAGPARPAALARTFGDLEAGALGVVEDSFGWAAVVVAGGSAARALDARLHDPVTVESDVP